MRMRFVSSDVGFLKTFGQEKAKASCRLISSITQKMKEPFCMDFQ